MRPKQVVGLALLLSSGTAVLASGIPLEQPLQAIVKLKEGATDETAIARLAAQTSCRIAFVRAMSLDAAVITVESTQCLRRLAVQPEVRYAEPDKTMKAQPRRGNP